MTFIQLFSALLCFLFPLKKELGWILNYKMNKDNFFINQGIGFHKKIQCTLLLY